MSNPEKQVENKIKNYLASIGAYFEKIHGGSIYQASGIPDILACYKGRFIAIEVKRPEGGVTSPLQKLKLKQIEDAGGVAIVARSVEEVRDQLEQGGDVSNV